MKRILFEDLSSAARASAASPGYEPGDLVARLVAGEMLVEAVEAVERARDQETERWARSTVARAEDEPSRGQDL